MALKRMSLKVSEELYDFISADGEKRGLSMNAVVIFALETYYQQMNAMSQLPKMMEELERERNQEK